MPRFRITLYIRDYTVDQPTLGVTDFPASSVSVYCLHVGFPTCVLRLVPDVLIGTIKVRTGPAM